MATSAVIFGLLFLLFVFNSEIDCKSRVGEICGLGQPGDKAPQSPGQKKEEAKAEENEDDPANGKYFYQGDILLTQEEKKELDQSIEENKNGQKRDVTSRPGRKWDDPQNIPYALDSTLSENAKVQIKAAIRDFHLYTCLQFKEKTADSDYYIRFKKGDGCYSRVGQALKGIKDYQELSIGEKCEYKGTVIHEMLHAVGLFHEHTRLDRDQYIKVLEQNIRDGKGHNFVVSRNQENLGVSYDYSSVMHYRLSAFSKNRLPTLEPTGDTEGAEIGQRRGFSDSDIEQVRILYGCPKVSLVKRAILPRNETVSRFFGGREKRRIENGGDKKPDDEKGGRCEMFAKMQAKQSS